LIDRNQALSQLCSAIGTLKIINIDGFCNPQQPLNTNPQLDPKDDSGINGSPANVQTPSGSLIDSFLGLLP
jgi:hypothetical protein